MGRQVTGGTYAEVYSSTSIRRIVHVPEPMAAGEQDPLSLPVPDPRDGHPSRYAEPLDTEEGGGLNIGRYISALFRYKWMIAALALVGFGVGSVLTRFVKPTYEAQATIQIDLTSRQAIQPTPIRSSQLLESRSWNDLLRSFLVLDEVVRRRRLFIEHSAAADAPLFREFTLAESFEPGSYRLTVDASGARGVLSAALDGSRIEEFAIGDSVGRSLGFRWKPSGLAAGRVVEFTVRTPRDAAVRLGDALQAPPLGLEASFLRISLRGTDPQAITATINAVAERFVEVATFLKRDKLTQMREILAAQLERSAVELRAAENALETFKINTITLPSDRGASPIASGLAETRDPVRLAFFRLRVDRDSLVMERDAIARALATADSTVSLVITLGAIPAARNSPELSGALTLLAEKRTEARQLRLAFGPTHPDLQKVDREIAELAGITVPTQARGVIANLDQRIADLEARIAAQGREMQSIPARASEEARLEREVEIQDNLYVQLQAAFEQARLAELSAAPDVRILDNADVPRQPLQEQVLLIVAGGLAVGFGLGVLLALVLDHFDRRIRYPEQVTRELGLTIIGALPLVRRDKDGRANQEDSDQLLESIRGVRSNLGWAHGTAGTFITTITSPGPGDGKSFLSANLARSFASAGRRTLLIDADTRRGILHRTLETTRKPGLLELLAGEVGRDRAIRSVPSWGIDFLPCGARRATSPELLASPAMAQVILGLRADYEAIIIDSPPLGAGIDPLVLSTLSGSLVLVLRNGVTDKELAEARLQDLDRLPVRILGAVVNDVKAKGMYRTYSYLPGYRSDEDDPSEGDSPARPAGVKLLGRR